MLRKHKITASLEVIVTIEIEGVDEQDAWGLAVERYNQISDRMSTKNILFNGITTAKVVEQQDGPFLQDGPF